MSDPATTSAERVPGQVSGPSLVAAPPPDAPTEDLSPEQLEFYVRAAMHQDRSPGRLLVVLHPGKLHKVPRGLFAALESEGFEISIVETDADRIASVGRIKDELVALADGERPLDLLVVSGDGSLDHHVLVAAFWAFCPQLVRYRGGCIDCTAVLPAELESLPVSYRETFFAAPLETAQLQPSEAVIKDIWLLRNRLEKQLRRGRPAEKIVRRAKRSADDIKLRVAILATLFPDKVVLRSDGFDLRALAEASQADTFQGLYPFVRCICTYPAGTAADNAVFAGVPGWGYAFHSGWLSRISILNPFRRLLERRLTRKFLDYFLRESVVVPARLSVVGFDGDWQRISSHAAGGPGAGHFFSADLTSKTGGMLGYIKRIPGAVIGEGLLGSTIVRLRSTDASGQEKSFIEAQIAEGLYTNRTFIAGIGSVPTTDPTSFAGQSSLCVIPPIWSRDQHGRRILDFRGLGAFTEAIVKGILARLLHVTGLGVGKLAGGGKFSFLLPEHQVAIKEGEEISIDYSTLDRRPRAINIQVSGDPFQAYKLAIRVIWGPIPLLGAQRSLLLASTRRSLANVRLLQSYRLQGVYIGGMYFFRHLTGPDWSEVLVRATGLIRPPRHLPRNLVTAQRRLLESWQKAGAGEFVDTTESGLALWRRGRYAHNNDQSAHLLLLREPHGTVFVRQVRAAADGSGDVYEARSYYRPVWGSYIILHSQTILWQGDDAPRILQEDHYFRDAQEFQQEAPTFFPVLARNPEEPTLLPQEIDGSIGVHGDAEKKDASAVGENERGERG